MYSFTKSSMYRGLSLLIVFLLIVSLVLTPSAGYAQSILNLPIAGTMVLPTEAFVPVLLKGMTIHPENPLKFDFIIDKVNYNNFRRSCKLLFFPSLKIFVGM